MKAFILVFVSVMCLQGAWAEEKTCTVKGMECAGCVDVVKEKICDQKFSTCEVKIKNADQHIGQIHLVTRDRATRVDEKALAEAIASTSYTLDKCTSKL